MKTLVNYESKKYVVNENKKVVVCILEFSIDCSELNAYNFIYRSPRYFASDIKWDGDVAHFIVRGKSTCTENDTFDIELGKKIALTRAQEKAFTRASKMYGRMADAIYDEFMFQLHTLEDNCIDCAADCFGHSLNLCGNI